MHTLGKPRSPSSGQTLLIAVIVLAFLMVGVSVIFFTNQIGSFHQTSSAQRTKARSLSEEGLGYAAQVLSADANTWKMALGASFPTDCNNGNVSGPSGGKFQIFCSTGNSGNPKLQTYQVAVVAVSPNPNGSASAAPLRSMQAYFSQRTLGTDLATGLHAGVALQMVNQPDSYTQLNVHWGPILCLDATTSSSWAVQGPIDAGRYPRKFAVAGITGTSYTRSASGLLTDQKEYWAQAPQGFVPLVDETYYKTLAQHTHAADPTPTSGGAVLRNCPVSGFSDCGYFTPTPGDVYIFDAAAPGYSLSGGVEGAALYIDGSAQFLRVAIDSAAVVVTNGLTLGNPAGTGTQPDLHVPVTAASEYPYSATWPCKGKEGDTLASGQPQYDCAYSQVFTGNVQFRGFLYVKINLILSTANWNMVGSLLVGDMAAPLGTGGRIVLQPPFAMGYQLNLAYDDVINHAIHMNPVLGSTIQIGPDLIQDIANH